METKSPTRPTERPQAIRVPTAPSIQNCAHPIHIFYLQLSRLYLVVYILHVERYAQAARYNLFLAMGSFEINWCSGNRGRGDKEFVPAHSQPGAGKRFFGN